MPVGSTEKDPIPVVITKEEIDVSRTKDSDTCTLINDSAETLSGAVYRVAYQSLLPAEEVESQNGCPVGDFEIEQLSPIALSENGRPL